MIGRVDDLDNPKALTEVWRRAMPVVELSRMRPEHYLNGLEDDVMEVWMGSDAHPDGCIGILPMMYIRHYRV